MQRGFCVNIRESEREGKQYLNNHHYKKLVQTYEQIILKYSFLWIFSNNSHFYVYLFSSSPSFSQCSIYLPVDIFFFIWTRISKINFVTLNKFLPASTKSCKILQLTLLGNHSQSFELTECRQYDKKQPLFRQRCQSWNKKTQRNVVRYVKLIKFDHRIWQIGKPKRLKTTKKKEKKIWSAIPLFTNQRIKLVMQIQIFSLNYFLVKSIFPNCKLRLIKH